MRVLTSSWFSLPSEPGGHFDVSVLERIQQLPKASKNLASLRENICCFHIFHPDLLPLRSMCDKNQGRERTGFPYD